MRTGLIADTTSFSSVDGPGNRFVIFLQGCNFDCVACHNPQTIPGHEPMGGFDPRRLSVDELIARIERAAPFVRGVTASGGEATQQAPFLHHVFEAIKSDPTTERLTCFVDSNGACEPSTWDLLAPVMDGAMIDLKCFDDRIHRGMTGHGNADVLASIRHLADLGLLYEVRLLLIDGVNDDPGPLGRTAAWLADVDARMRLKLIAFRPHGVRAHEPPLVQPTAEQMDRAADVFREVGQFAVTVV